MEIWKTIPDYPNYMVSNLDNIKSFKNGNENILKQKLDSKKNYLQITLRNKYGVSKTLLVHRIVAISFLCNINNLPVVNHKDTIKTNNNVSNLEWVTYSDNSKHAYINNLITIPKPFKGKFGKEHNRSKQYKLKCPNGEIKIFGSGLEFYRETGLDHTSLFYASKKQLPYKFADKYKLRGYELLEVLN